MRISYATVEQIKEFEYKLYEHHKKARDIEFEYPNIEKCLDRENMCVYDGDTLVGFISFKRITKEYVEIKRLYVEKEFRRTRIATQMINLIFDNLEVETLSAKVYTFEGIKFFLWQGFNVDGVNRNGSINMSSYIL